MDAGRDRYEERTKRRMGIGDQTQEEVEGGNGARRQMTSGRKNRSSLEKRRREVCIRIGMMTPRATAFNRRLGFAACCPRRTQISSYNLRMLFLAVPFRHVAEKIIKALAQFHDPRALLHSVGFNK